MIALRNCLAHNAAAHSVAAGHKCRACKEDVKLFAVKPGKNSFQGFISMIGDVVVAADNRVDNFNIGLHHGVEHHGAAHKAVVENRRSVGSGFAAHLTEELVDIMNGFHHFCASRT